MTVEADKAIARREIEKYEGKGDVALAGALFGPDYVLHSPGFPPLGRAGHQKVLAGFREAFPDLGIDILRVRGGRIVHDCVRADMVGLLGQIGALPAPG